MIPMFAKRPSPGFDPGAPDFNALLADAGAGAVVTSFTGYGVATFVRATIASTVDSAGLIANVASGVARSRYDPATLTYQGYFAEGAATNLCLQSEDFGTTWAAVGTPTRSAAAATCGTLVLDLLGDDDGSGLEGYTQTVTFTGNAVKAISIFFKEGTSSSSVIQLLDTSAPATRLLAAITWSGGVPTVTMTTGTLIQTVGPFGASGVYRAEMLTTSVTAANTNSFRVYPATDAALDTSATGNLNFGGAMAENSALACAAYIPTTTATVTKNADSLVYLAANMSASAGTAYAEVVSTQSATATNASPFLDGGATTTGLLLGRQTLAALTTISMDDGPNMLEKTGLTSIFNAIRKRASAWGGTTQSITGDGAAVSSGTFDTTMTATSVRVNTQPLGCGVCMKEVKIWTTNATDTQLVTLTT